MASELIDEMLDYSEGLELKNKEKILQKAEEIYRFFIASFPERRMKRNTILSSCLYLATLLHGEHASQSNLARSFNVSQSTLNKRYKEIVKAIRTRCEKEFVKGWSIGYRNESFSLQIPLDRKIFRTCRILTSIGLETVSSCQGHFRGEKEYRRGGRRTPYVAFVVKNKENFEKLKGKIEGMQKKKELEVHSLRTDSYEIEFKAKSSQERDSVLKKFDEIIRDI